MAADFDKSDVSSSFAHPCSPERFTEITRECYSPVYLTALSVTRQAEMAEDIAQETFLRVWMKLHDLKDVRLVKPWLIRVARNLAIDWLRTGQTKSRIIPLMSLEEVTMEPVDVTKPDPRQVAENLERQEQVVEAVMALPDDLRQAVLLHYAEGMSSSEIARLNGEAASTVTRRLDKANKHLRQYLESGLVAGLAASVRNLRPRKRQLDKILGLLAAAAVLPASTRAQFLHLISDTPPPPLVDSAALTANAATIEETGMLNTLMAKSGAAKFIAGTVLIAAIGGGAYAVKSLTHGTVEISAENASDISKSNIRKLQNSHPGGRIDLTSKSSQSSRTKPVSDARSSKMSNTSATAGARLPLNERIALLQNELVSTQPLYVADDGKTSAGTYLNMQVIDGSGLPISNATLRLSQLSYRSDFISGSIGIPVTTGTEEVYTVSGYAIRPGITDSEGYARMFIPEFVQGQQKTSGFMIRATHPDYAATQAEMELTSITRIVMTGGNLFTVIPVDKETFLPIVSNVTAHFDSPFQPDWEQRSDGTIAVRKVSGDSLQFYLTHTTDDGRILLSDYQKVEVPRADKEPIPVAIGQGLTVRGSLSPNVPRPITSGTVEARGAAGPACSQYAWQEVDVAPDGTFLLTNLPPGDVLIAGLTDQFNSTRPLVEQVTTHHAIPHRFHLTEDNQEYVLPMEARCTLRFTFVFADGTPAIGAPVWLSTMMCFDGCCKNWDEQFSKVTDDDGIVELKNIPSAQLGYVYIGEGWKITSEKTDTLFDRHRQFNMKLVSGETIEKTVTVERITLE